ncbi:MAG: hypothetical protein ACT4N1_01955 [Nitrososphaerota archaeon]
MKEKVIVFGILTASLLPLRIFFYTYVSQYWLGSAGVLSVVALTLFVLAKKKKLGKFGYMFENQMASVTRGKLGKAAFVITILSISFFAASLSLIEKANTFYYAEKAQFEQILKGATPSSYKITGNENRFDFIPSVSTAIVNDLTNGWMQHVSILILVGEFEALAVLILYRKGFRKDNLYNQ